MFSGKAFVSSNKVITLQVQGEHLSALTAASEAWEALVVSAARLGLALWTTGADVEIWSGRSGEVADKTAAWLASHGLGHIPIKMRAEGDHRHDTVLKAEWLDACDVKPSLIFEDRSRVVEMWRSRGIVCCQVAPGEF